MITCSKPLAVNRSSAACSMRGRTSPRTSPVASLTAPSCAGTGRWGSSARTGRSGAGVAGSTGVTNLRGTPLAPPEDRMPETPHADVETTEAPVAEPTEDLVEEESLVEEVSIDGMCGVY